ncbi:D-alanyl-D-alanine carboxypeptidase, partial [Citricoccus sp.]|uniref:D-alanyl-D-alanine carboxypeptidase n=1 Tax=Citricoccus sp. TaxID=1978372 RepID=UPI002C694BD3
MTSRPPRRRPAARAIPRTLGAALALLLAGTVTGGQVQGAQTGAAPSGPTPALAVSSTITAGAASSPTSASSTASASSLASASDPSSPAAPTSSSSPARPAATGAHGPGEGGSTLAAVLGLSGLTALLDPMPDPEALAPALDEALTVSSGTMSAAVVDVLTGEVLYDRSADEPAVPASAVKILTGLAALEVLGPGHRYTTGAVALPG